MFVLSSQGNAMYQAVAMLVTFALALWMLNIHTFAQAANLLDVSNTLSDSDRSVVSNHTIEFTIPPGSPGIAAAQAFTVRFPNGFNLSTSSVAFGDIDFLIDGVNQTLVGAAPAAGQWSAAISGQLLTFTSGGGAASSSANDVLEIRIGTNATGGVNRVTNHPVAGSYEFVITLPADTGRTRVAILDDVVVTASVATVFDFVVSGFPAVTGVNVNGTTTTGTSSATSLAFGQLVANQIETLAQRLNVTTNARNGFVVTVFQSGDLLSTTGADINSFFDSTYENTPSDWAAPSNLISDNRTWGHWGLTSSDDINGGEFQACVGAANGCWVAASTTPRQVFSATSSADGIRDNVGSTTVGYQIQITSLQEAADDYSTTLTYIATPTF